MEGIIKVMRPLFHPSIDDITVESVLHALSDPVRVAIYVQIATSDCSRICSNFLQVSEKSIPKSTLSQHFKALREAGLIRGERRGVEMHNTTRCEEIDKRFPGLVRAIVTAYAIQSGITLPSGLEHATVPVKAAKTAKTELSGAAIKSSRAAKAKSSVRSKKS